MCHRLLFLSPPLLLVGQVMDSIGALLQSSQDVFDCEVELLRDELARSSNQLHDAMAAKERANSELAAAQSRLRTLEIKRTSSGAGPAAGSPSVAATAAAGVVLPSSSDDGVKAQWGALSPSAVASASECDDDSERVTRGHSLAAAVARFGEDSRAMCDDLAFAQDQLHRHNDAIKEELSQASHRSAGRGYAAGAEVKQAEDSDRVSQ